VKSKKGVDRSERQPLVLFHAMSSQLDATTSHLASRLAATKQKFKEAHESDEELDDEAIFAELEAELEEESGAGMAEIREKGMQALKQE
jgi:hypothetical protein